MGIKACEQAISRSQARLLVEELGYIQMSCWSWAGRLMEIPQKAGCC